MEINKSEKVSIIKLLDKLYVLFSRKNKTELEFINQLPIVVNILEKIHPIFRSNDLFVPFFNYTYNLMSNQSSINAADEKIKKFLLLLEKFELSLIGNTNFDVFLNKGLSKKNIPFNTKYVDKIIDVSSQTEEDYERGHNFSVLISSNQLDRQETSYDFILDLEKISDLLNLIADGINSIDYYMYDKLYLEAKLESLKKRQDIQILLAGSSYTMCGLFEKQMPLPARNVAIDAQDLYYTLKTIRTALDYNNDIKYCIISFAYYFWGYDLSLSTSTYQYRRITEVNYPIFKDKRNFPGIPDEDIVSLLKSATPLEKKILSLDFIEKNYLSKIKERLQNSNYYPYERIDSEVIKNDESTNEKNAEKRASSHNKFFKYKETVKENHKLFSDFLSEMNSKDIKIILFVPPVTVYYRKFISPAIVDDFYKYMKQLQKQYDFKLVDLFNSDVFKEADFADYDHLNDLGAKKLGDILIKELGYK
ncbi:hypothetical protein AB1K89_04525 [Sporosarcina sp. 179-K 8C2 HS]|uniref:hypothetical protein n=1 Tax=Sporosarcina sp. 179-K 8C2 HS TaxID=3142387 RepID=UPI0039A14B53